MFGYIYQISERKPLKEELISADAFFNNPLMDFDMKGILYVSDLDYASRTKALKKFDLSFKDISKRDANIITFTEGSDVIEETAQRIQKELNIWNERLKLKEADSIKIPPQLHKLSYESSREVKDLFYMNSGCGYILLMHFVDLLNYIINRNKINYYIGNIIQFYKNDLP